MQKRIFTCRQSLPFGMCLCVQTYTGTISGRAYARIVASLRARISLQFRMWDVRLAEYQGLMKLGKHADSRQLELCGIIGYAYSGLDLGPRVRSILLHLLMMKCSVNIHMFMII